MSRVPQRLGMRGSLKWIQRLVNGAPALLDGAILPRLCGATSIRWVSPLANDDYAEYRDADFLKRVALAHLAPALRDFWPERGPQWDALGLSDKGDVLLIEAKAHIDELCSPGTTAGEASRARIEAALARVADAHDVTARAAWADVFYQLANRLAHLHLLRAQGVPAWLVLVNVVGDSEMHGPATAAEWEAAYRVVLHVMGIGTSNRLLRHVIHAYPQARAIA